MLQDVLAVKEGAILALRSSHAAVARAASAKDVELCKVKAKLAKVCCRWLRSQHMVDLCAVFSSLCRVLGSMNIPCL